MWNCPKCGEEVDDDFDVCWECGTTADGVEDPNFQSAEESGPLDDPALDLDAEEPVELDELPGPPEELVECFEARDTIEAKFIADQLREQGIPAVADRRNANFSLGGYQHSLWGYGPRVTVRQRDLDRAREWLALYVKRREAREAERETEGTP
jgi:hypothetical protein